MNKFKKYCPAVWVAECEEEYEKDRCCCHCGQRLKWHE